MRKLLLILVPTLFIALSSALLVSTGWLKEPFSEDDRLQESIQALESHIKNQEWGQASQTQKKAEKAWESISKRIQFSVDREIMFEINGSLSRIKGSIEGRDQESTLIEIYYFYTLWESI
ncbi:DUF4363 family protein [Halalkalibacterium ligniniphilum]|uniref:DUF4363 family protein n=1 Tax=Halalkalibacterium ligniniphilum TaxID=1134413 RepID=UPI000344F0C1|nr:DUF4363 family protein [Halalkalibacterium ligniniphilum]